MAQYINTNIASLNAQRNLSTSQSALATSLQRLSSGLRINSAKDDAAGMSISTRMTSQINGLNQAARNANDGISLAQTAEGALNEITNNLQRIRDLSVQSANATNTSSDRASIQAEVNQITSEITRVAGQTQFNGLNLLDGTFTAQVFQVGANAGQSIAISSIADSRSSNLGGHSLTTNGTAMSPAAGHIVAGTNAAAAINGVTAETNLTLTTNAGTSAAISYAVNSGADQIASALNAAASGLGVHASANNSTTLSGLSAPGTITFNLTGGAGAPQAISAVITDQNDLSNLVSSINGVQGTTGITAAFTSTNSKASITLSTSDGRNITLDTFANSGAATNDSVSFGGTTLTEGATNSAVATGAVSLTSSEGPLTVANSNADVFGATSSSFLSVAAVDVSTASGAQAALAALDAALAQTNSSRAALGAYQNRFSSAIANLQTTSENLTASRSRIQDTDFAMETGALTRAQILQQAGTAMLAQANSTPNGVLTLLR